ncbi:GxxExxY protein [Pelagicoccus sp. SDUM812002]|uniref:GxxExxY protein n=1 Tax=Pelagicoccus sp. SDUM812002 TaxID=3041266 RepID=UPI00280C5EC6|nr:GxxExxY protein [Pelagicoccus sp. SDUM812002]MDQ8187432.1 GxxExxY protein [Pelagicoccus sp. SDUM812002]
MNADDFEYKTETFAIIGAAMEVSNILGHGLKEKPYENALVVEFGLQSIPHLQQPRFEIDYKGTNVGDYIPDLIAYDKIVVDTKVVEQIGDNEVGQMLNYLAITKHRTGLIINFKHSKLEWKRVVRTNS